MKISWKFVQGMIILIQIPYRFEDTDHNIVSRDYEHLYFPQ